MNTKISKTFFIIQVCTVNAGLGPDLAIGTDPVKKGLDPDPEHWF